MQQKTKCCHQHDGSGHCGRPATQDGSALCEQHWRAARKSHIKAGLKFNREDYSRNSALPASLRENIPNYPPHAQGNYRPEGWR